MHEAEGVAGAKAWSATFQPCLAGLCHSLAALQVRACLCVCMCVCVCLCVCDMCMHVYHDICNCFCGLFRWWL